MVGIPASLVVFDALRLAVEDVARLRFERQASDAKAVVEGRIRSYANVLYGLKALFATHDRVSRVQFNRFVTALDLKNRYPGFDVVNFAAHVLGHDAERFVESVRHDTSLVPGGYPEFTIRPPGQRPEYFVLAYLEPLEGYEFAFGRDLGANPQVPDPAALAAVMRMSRDTGKLTASGLPIKIRTGKEYVGLAMRLPVYRLGMPLETVEQRRAAYIGSVGAGFNIEELMRGVFAEQALREIRFALYDVGAAGTRGTVRSERRLLFDSDQLISSGHKADENFGSGFSRALSMDVGGREWQLELQAPKRVGLEGLDLLLPWVVLLGGIVSSVLLCAVLFSLASSRSRAVAIATDMTRNLRESEASLADAQRMAQLGNWSLDGEGRAMKWSSQTYRIFGREPQAHEEITFDAFLRLIHDDDRALVQDALLGASQARQHRDIEHRIALPDGSVKWVHTIVQGDAGPPVPGTIMDITERKLAEQELVESRALLNDAQKLAQVGCCQYNPLDGRVIWSDELYRIYGVDPRTFTPTYASAMKLAHPLDRAAWGGALATALRTGESFTTEFRIRRPDGSVRHLRSLGEVIKDAAGRPLRMLWSVVDITEHKYTEHALRASAEQLTALSRRLVEIQEAERRHLSRELHDRVGQNLTALSINLDMLRTSLSGDNCAEHRARLTDSSALLEATVDSIENVMAELRPPMLDDYGLLPALHWYAKDFCKRTGVEVRVEGNEGTERLPAETEITLFRIAQEALTNVAKHARAHHAQITLDHSARHCVMTITDDGIGIAATGNPDGTRRPRLGMVTMRERSQAVGARFSVTARPGGGTQVAISIP